MAELLAGTATAEGLNDALRKVAERRAAFSLIVSDGISERVFYFAIGGVRVVGSGTRASPYLGEILVQQGRLDSEQLERVLYEGRHNGKRFGDAAVALGYLTYEEVLEGMKLKVVEEILDLYLWSDSEFRLLEGQPPKEFYEGKLQSASISCDVPTFLRAVMGRLDEWSTLAGRVPTGREVYEVQAGVDLRRVPQPFSKLLSYLDGSNTVSAAVKRSGIRRVAAYEFLFQSIRDGLVHRVAGSTAQAVTREQLVEEIGRLESALGTSVAPDIVRRRLARALENVGEKAKASERWRQLGDSARRENDLVTALEHYRQCVRLQPTDFATRELVLEIHRHQDNPGAVVSEGRPLADLFIKHNLLNRARKLLESLVNLDEKDTSLRRQLVMVLLGLGERDAALLHLRAIARVLEERNAPPAELRDVYVRILSLDKHDKLARKRLDALTGVAFQRKVTYGVIGMTAVLLLAAGCFFAYETVARRHIKAQMEEAQALLLAGDTDGARLLLINSVDRFRFSRASGMAVSMIERIDREATRREAGLAPGAEFGGADPDDPADLAARRLAQRARTHLAEGRPVEAHKILTELFRDHPTASLLSAVEMPMRISVLPVDSTVLVDGVEIGRGTQQIEYLPTEGVTVEVTHPDGFAAYRETLVGPQPFQLTVELGKPTLWEPYQSDAAFDASPLILGDAMILAGRDRYVTALSLKDGKVRWRTPLGLYADVGVSPVATSEGIVIATAGGDTVCLDPVTGRSRWSRDLSQPVLAQPVVVPGESVVVPLADGSIEALAAASGERTWSGPPGTIADGAPVLDEHARLTFVNHRSALVRAEAATGRRESGWVADARGLSGTPLLDGDRVWVRGAAQLSLVSAETGRLLRTTELPEGELFGPVAGDESVHLVSADGLLLSFGPDGKPLHEPRRLPEAPAAAPTYADGLLYLPGVEGHLTVADATTGELLWRQDAGAPLTAPPVVLEDGVYLVTRQGTVIALAR